MAQFLEMINVFFEDYFGFALPTVHITDVVEIFIITFFFYQVLLWINNTRAWLLLRGILIIMLFFIVASLFRMSTILWLGEKLFNAGVIAIIIVFQPEFRHALEQLGRRNFIVSFFSGLGKTVEKRFDDRTLNDLVKACYEMGAVRTGALIVIEQEVALTEYERTGIPIDAILTRQLLINIFEKNTPLHDGAILVRGDRVVAATCYLPLTDNMNLPKDLGTRHRAAVGISEVTDALTIVVSEETGMVSVTKEGRLTHDLSSQGLTDILHHIQQPEQAPGEDLTPKKGLRLFRRRSGHVE